MISILLETLHKPNIFAPNSCDNNFFINYYCPKHRAFLPTQFHSLDIEVYTKTSVSKLDWFVYPIIVNEPYYQIRSLIKPYDPTYGLFSLISEEILNAIKDNKGVIYVDITAEPINDPDLKELVSTFKNTDLNIVFNIPSEDYCDGKVFFNLLGWMESFFLVRPLRNQTFNGFSNKTMFSTREQKAFSLFNARYDKHAGATIISHLLDRYNLFKKGHVYIQDKGRDIKHAYEQSKSQFSLDSPLLFKFRIKEVENTQDIYEIPIWIYFAMKYSYFNLVVEAYYFNDSFNFPYITEKMWRNLPLNKPFVVVGQKHLLKSFKKLGYKSFHPYIDESYDNFSDNDRVLRVFKETKRLCSFTENDWITFNKKTEHIHTHNKYNFSKRQKDFIDVFRPR